MVALIDAGCSSGSSAGTGSGSRGGDNTAANHEKAVKFAECMRDNGVTEFPDPDQRRASLYPIGELARRVRTGLGRRTSTEAPADQDQHNRDARRHPQMYSQNQIAMGVRRYRAITCGRLGQGAG
jgi:hypothetical protein